MALRPLSRERIVNQLATKSFGGELLILDKCTSTNDVAHEKAKEGAIHGFTVIVEQQTAARGRWGRSWVSPKGGIWMTIILRPPAAFAFLDSLPLVGALAVARAVNSDTTAQALVRWPNDVVINHRKLAGVLAESTSRGGLIDHVLLGLGVNVNFHTSKVREISKSSISLLSLLGSPVDRERLISSILLETENLYNLLCSGRDSDVLALLRETDWSQGKRVRVLLGNRTITGTIVGYESLAKVRLSTPANFTAIAETSAVVTADYLD